MRLWAATWERIKQNFSEEEKAQLRNQIKGEFVCPKGWELEEKNLPDQLRAKIKNLLASGQ